MTSPEAVSFGRRIKLFFFFFTFGHVANSMFPIFLHTTKLPLKRFHHQKMADVNPSAVAADETMAEAVRTPEVSIVENSNDQDNNSPSPAAAEAKNALEANIAAKGDNAYYYAHKSGAGTPSIVTDMPVSVPNHRTRGHTSVSETRGPRTNNDTTSNKGTIPPYLLYISFLQPRLISKTSGEASNSNNRVVTKTIDKYGYSDSKKSVA